MHPKFRVDGRRRRKSSRSERAGGAAAKKKVRTISELVKLVISGEVKVPKCLRHYMDDRPQLLDQTFTILSESDVRGMLPDILQARNLPVFPCGCLLLGCAGVNVAAREAAVPGPTAEHVPGGRDGLR